MEATVCSDETLHEWRPIFALRSLCLKLGNCWKLERLKSWCITTNNCLVIEKHWSLHAVFKWITCAMFLQVVFKWTTYAMFLHAVFMNHLSRSFHWNVCLHLFWGADFGGMTLGMHSLGYFALPQAEYHLTPLMRYWYFLLNHNLYYTFEVVSHLS